MNYSRRNFLKAAGSGIALTVVGEGPVLSAGAAPLTLASPITNEKATFTTHAASESGSILSREKKLWRA